MRTTVIKKLKEHQIPAPVEAVSDNLLELSMDKLAISSIKIIKVNSSISVANTSVITEGHASRQRISLGVNRGRRRIITRG